MKNANKLLPVSPAVLHILLALAGEEMHGYGIMQEVAHQSGGHYKLGPGTLYDNLQRLTEQGLVKEVVSRAGEVDSRRRYYRLTKLGQRVIAAEIRRLENMVRVGKLRLRAWGVEETS